MKLVVDANVVFSAFIKDSKTRELILKRKLDLLAPEFILDEIKKYSSYIQSKTQLSKEQFKNIEELIFAQISVVPKTEFSKFIPQGQKISPDKNDSHYFALALHSNCPLWSNDSPLKEQGAVKVFTTKELLEQLKQ